MGRPRYPANCDHRDTSQPEGTRWTVQIVPSPRATLAWCPDRPRIRHHAHCGRRHGCFESRHPELRLHSFPPVSVGAPRRTRTAPGTCKPVARARDQRLSRAGIPRQCCLASQAWTALEGFKQLTLAGIDFTEPRSAVRLRPSATPLGASASPLAHSTHSDTERIDFLPGLQLHDRGQANLEGNVSEHLNHSGIAAVELIESPEQRIAGDQVVARVDKAVHPNVVHRAAGKLRVIEDVVHLRADIERVPLPEVEPFLQIEVDVIDPVERKRIPSAVGNALRNRRRHSAHSNCWPHRRQWIPLEVATSPCAL